MDLSPNASIADNIQIAIEHLMERLSALLPLLSAAIVVLLIFWVLAVLVRRAARYGSKFIKNPMKASLIRMLSYYTVWLIGIFVALDVVGVDARSLATGLGLGGVALGFALKDVLSNLVSGLFILIAQTFEIGDQIVVGETEGTVERIQIRATHIRTYDGRLVLVPNGEVFMSRVTNNTASELRRTSVFVYLEYGQDIELAMSLILKTVKAVPGVATNPAASIRLRDLTTEHFYIESRFWTDSRRTKLRLISSDVRLAIIKALENAGIELPNPNQRDVSITKTSD
ncbi:mechanosensitive ion channel protein (mscS family) [Janthinobacterium sp. Marseille]|nr:mechanosensitive ion channel family protein [Janthinobacterium sp. Marseille]ABR91452.1 mechanosensitive ion channel protein (mscS family) [Janthinobacterium sp. Marseille]